MEIIKKDHKRVVEILGKKELTMSEIQDKLNPERNVDHALKVTKTLHSAGLVDTIKDGKTRKVKLNKNGLYYLELFRKLDGTR